MIIRDRFVFNPIAPMIIDVLLTNSTDRQFLHVNWTVSNYC